MLHLLHFCIIIEHGHAPRQDCHCQDAAECPQKPHHALLGSGFRLPGFHFPAEIMYHLIVYLGVYSPGLAPGHHIILHHLVALIVDIVAPQLVKAVFRSGVYRFFIFHAGIQVHQLICAGKIPAVKLPVI